MIVTIEKSELDNLREKQLNTLKQTLEDIDDLYPHLRNIHIQLAHVSKELMEHYYGGDTNNQDQNSKLWHGLYNVEHKIANYHLFLIESVDNFKETCEQLTKILSELRPHK